MSRELEDRVAAFAAGRHGVVTRGQLLGLGLSSASIGRRVASGRLRTLHGGVYLLGPVESERATQLAAVLAGGPTAALSHMTAARLWRLLDVDASAPIHVSVVRTGRDRGPGVRFHRVAAVAEDERAIVDGIPVTAPLRTLVDIAEIGGSRELELATSVAEQAGLIDRQGLCGLPQRYRGRPGMPALRALIRDDADPALTRSEAERRCLDLLRSAGLPRPHANVPMGPYELDLFWPNERIAVEIDGRAYHSSRRRFEGDRRKDAWLRARGVDVIRLTWRQITRDGMATAVQVGQALALARSRSASTPGR